MENTNKDMKDHRMIILAPFIRQLKKTFTYETIALLLEVSRQTIYKWAHFDFEGEATKQAKKDVKSIPAGSECGLLFDSRTEIKIGDILILR